MDDEGKVTMSSRGMLTYCVSAEYAEALAILEGIKSIVNLDASQIHMESDCAAIVQDLNMTDQSKAATSHIITKVKNVAHYLILQSEKGQ